MSSQLCIVRFGYSIVVPRIPCHQQYMKIIVCDSVGSFGREYYVLYADCFLKWNAVLLVS